LIAKLAKPTTVEANFEGFRTERVETPRTMIKYSLRRRPQRFAVAPTDGILETHVLCRKVAPALAQEHFVVMMDLRGYGDSRKPPSSGDHFTYSKQAMAQDQVEAMRHLAFEKLALVGHFEFKSAIFGGPGDGSS
jgi:haloacetate dehalogenase